MSDFGDGGQVDWARVRPSPDEAERRQRIYCLMFEHAGDPTLIVDDEGQILDENNAMRALYADGLGDLFPRQIGAWALRNVDVGSFHQELLLTGRAEVEARATDGAGRRRVIAITAKTHAPGRHVLVLRDVTEQRDTEECLERIRRVDSLGLLTASVVHDLANFLTPIVSASTLLALGAPEGSETAQLAEEIRMSADRAVSLVRRTVAFVRNKPPETSTVCLSAVLREILPLLHHLVGSSVKVALDLDPEPCDVTVDRDRLEQTIVNLVANARDAMPSGGTLTLGTREEQGADEPIAGARRFVSLRVTDTGVGMGPEVQGATADGFVSTKRDGAGLGLAAVRRFVAQSGGVVSVESRIGEGTSFILSLPRAAAPATADRPLPGVLP